MWRCNDELRVHADEVHRSSNKDEVAKHYIGVSHTLSLNSVNMCYVLYFVQWNELLSTCVFYLNGENILVSLLV